MEKLREQGAPKVAISIVHYRGEKMTRNVVGQLGWLNYPNYDIWVVDNSGDLGDDMPESVKVLRPGKNLGYAGGHNLVIRELGPEYDYVLTLNPDTNVGPEFLAPLVEAMEAEPRAAAASPAILYTKPADRIWYAGGEIMKNGMSRHLREGESWWEADGAAAPSAVGFLTGCSQLTRMSAMREIGLMDESFFLYFEDADWCARATRAGWKLLFVPGSVIHHAVSASSGINSPQYLYYNTRNRLVFVSRYMRGVGWWRGMLSVKIQTLKELVKIFTRYRRDYGRYIRLLTLAWIDFARGRKGPLK